MAIPNQPAFDLFGTFVHLDGAEAAPVKGGADFWREVMDGDSRDERIQRIAAGGWLVSATHLTQDARTWEKHPNGDEVLVLQSGAMDIVLQHDDGERIARLRAGEACIVPRGVWHRAIVRSPGNLLSVAFGAGTRHRAV